ncbi:MAG: S9 family peptidase [Kocuria sp.]|nr:S9 family peptidase [Kocuria sp.]
MTHSHHQRPQPPIAARRPMVREFHGDRVTDHYEWLRDKDSPEVLAHLRAETTYAESATAYLNPVRERIFQEITHRVQQTDVSVPYRRGDWWYYTRTVEGREHSIRCRTPATARGREEDPWQPPALAPEAGATDEEVLLDGNLEAAEHNFWSLGSFEVTPDGRWMLWSADTTGDERFTVNIKNLRTGEVLSDRIFGTADGAFITPDACHVFYIETDHTWRPWRLRKHRLGTPISQDSIVVQEDDPGLWLSATLSADRSYVIVESSCSEYAEVSLLRLEAPDGTQPQVVIPRSSRLLYQAEPVWINGQEAVLVSHNDRAPDGRLSLFDVTQLGQPITDNSFRDVLPPTPGQRVMGFTVIRDWVLVTMRSNTLPALAVLPLKNLGTARQSPMQLLNEHGLHRAPPHHSTAHTLWSSDTLKSIELVAAEHGSPVVRFCAESFTHPARMYDAVLDSPNIPVTPYLRREEAVLGGYDPSDYTVERDTATAADGTPIPVTVIRHRDAPTPAPAVIYAYGSYEISMDPAFSYSRVSLLDRGVTWVIAHVRGGGEGGRLWYESGKKLQKVTTFTDVIAVTKHVGARADIDANRLVLTGGSAGGLLVGAVLNMAPELYCGAVAVVPFVDPLTSLLMPELPLSALEWEEWGNPLEDPEAYASIKAYSPYDNIRATGVHATDDVPGDATESSPYPPILVTTSLHDTRVLYVEPAKWVAALRHAYPEQADHVLMRIDMTSGHGGASGRYQSWRDTAWEDAWILERLNLISYPTQAETPAGDIPFS